MSQINNAFTAIAGEDLSAHKGGVVYLDSTDSNKVKIYTAAVMGVAHQEAFILTNAPGDDERAYLAGYNDVAEAKYGAAITAANVAAELTVNASGFLIPATTGDHVVALARPTLRNDAIRTFAANDLGDVISVGHAKRAAA